jgi:2-oxoglutarate dehydrogenase E2 component (dihydrolipoamide succinyltransferase)
VTTAPAPKPLAPVIPIRDDQRTRRVAMTPIRKKIAAHLLYARQQTAMLTTFNEADLSIVQKLRSEHKEAFQQKHDVKLGLMSFFIRGCILALKEFPEVNARIDGSDIVYQEFYDIGVAIGGEKGLVVPVIRDVEQLDYADIEKAIQGYGEKVKNNKIELADLAECPPAAVAAATASSASVATMSWTRARVACRTARSCRFRGRRRGRAWRSSSTNWPFPEVRTLC